MRSIVGVLTVVSLAGGCSLAPAAPPATGSATTALTEEQCVVFDQGGKVTICHHTGAAQHPYTLVRVAANACVSAHANHEGDYVTSTDPASPIYDPTCNGQGCLPLDAPCDATLPCCEGLACENGVCIPLFDGLGSCVHSTAQEFSCIADGGEPSADATCPTFLGHQLIACFMGEECVESRLTEHPEPSCASGRGCFLDQALELRCLPSSCPNPPCSIGPGSR